MPQTSEEQFNQFQIEEYKNISTAHHETIKQYTSFFNYYLLILAAPAILITIIKTSDFNLSKFLTAGLPKEYYLISFFALLLISLIGFCLACFLINLRHDAVLYARTVNGVRKYFYDKIDKPYLEKNKYKVLPTNVGIPNYLEGQIFFPIIITFSLINSFFFLFGFWILSVCFIQINLFNISLNTLQLGYIISSIFFLLHFGVWVYSSFKRTHKYFQSYRIGIDLDGVINNQTDHFVNTYNRIFSTTFTTAQITSVPVRDIPGLNITINNEHTVFNNSEYWKSLSPLKDSISIVRRLRKEFGYEIYLFTHRPWPIYNLVNRTTLESAYPTSSFLLEANFFTSLILRFKNLFWKKKYWLNDLISITKTWLSQNGYSYDQLVIERGNEYSVYYRPFVLLKRYIVRYKNRYQLSRSRHIKIFVEDRIENAVKLGTICEIVFLIDAPYNQNLPPGYTELPKNILRIKEWKEILDWFKFNS